MEHLSPGSDSFSDLTLTIDMSHFVDRGADWRETKTRSGYTFWNIYKGSVFIEINGQTHEAGPGDSVLFYPGNSFTAWAGPEGCSYHSMRFFMEKGNHYDILAGSNLAGIYRSASLNRRCLDFCREYRSRYTSNKGHSVRFYAFCFDFLAELLDPPRCEEHFFEDEQAADDTLINRVADQIGRHFTDNLQIKDMARDAGMSEKYFIRYFQRYFNISPKQYIIELRMQYAAELLADTTDSIASIAEKLGYSDQYSFSKAFRKYYNESPTKFRKLMLR